MELPTSYSHLTSSPAISRLFHSWGSPGSGVGELELLKGLVVQVTAAEEVTMAVTLSHQWFPSAGQRATDRGALFRNSEGGERTLARASISPRAVQGCLPCGMHLVLKMTTSMNAG